MSKIKDQVKTLEPTAEKDPILSAKRKRAMVEYIAIMFSVAFLLVLLSLFVQNRTLKQTNSENNNTSLSLQGKIENLQSENRDLRVKLAQTLLEDAKMAFEAENMDIFAAKMQDLSAYVDALSTEEKQEYDQLSEQMPTEPVETE